MKKFPQNFLWGAATSAYQVEGGNSNSDWWPWEIKAGKEQSKAACRHYELYEQDFDLAKNLGHNTHRLSIEWARIEPKEGEFSQSEIEHYRRVIQALRARNIEPVVTLHHFTNPIWFAQSGGWTKAQSVTRFLRYCDVVVRALAKDVHYWITINEPTVYISHSFLWGVWPPQMKSYWVGKAVHDHMIKGHVQCYRLIHKIYRELSVDKPAVSLSQHVQAVMMCNSDLKNRTAVWIRDLFINFGILNHVTREKTMDFIGINYYSRQQVDIKNWAFGSLTMDVCKNNHDPVKKNSLGWDIYPQGLYHVLMKLKRYQLPIMITENGICTSDDALRWEFIVDHLKNIHLAMEQGVEVTGYLYWSLLDNFEWDKGFGPRFGLIEVDYATQQRLVRDSAKKFSHICQTGILE